MKIVTTDTIVGEEIIEQLGIAKGEVVQSKHIGQDFLSGLKNVVGGEIKAYTDMIKQARDMATARMMEEADRMGADAIVNVRYASSSVMQGASEILAYGTAVKLKQKREK